MLVSDAHTSRWLEALAPTPRWEVHRSVNGVARRLLAVPVESFYDDSVVGGAAFERGSGQSALGVLDSFFIGFEEDKHEAMQQDGVFLGVRSSFARTPLTGHVEIGVTKKRKDSIAVWISEVRAARALSRADAAKLAGKARFSLSPVFGRFGVAALRPILLRAQSHARDLTPELDDALSFLQRTLPALPPATVPLRPPRVEPVVVLSDASYSPHAGGRLGVVVWCPRRRRVLYCSLQVPAWMQRLFARLDRRKATYIGQMELLAVLAAYLTFPDVLAGQPVHHYVDNRSAIAGLISGYSGRADSGAVIHAFQACMLELQCRPWFSFVYSEDNLADLPSRFEYALLRRMGAERRQCVLPTLSSLLQW